MLILTRKLNQDVILSGGICITIVDIIRGNVRLGITAPSDVTVHRREIWEAMASEGKLPPAPESEQPRTNEGRRY